MDGAMKKMKLKKALELNGIPIKVWRYLGKAHLGFFQGKENFKYRLSAFIGAATHHLGTLHAF